MEGKIYHAIWRKTKGGYRLWLKDDTRFTTTSRRFAAAEEALIERICFVFGDGEALLDFDRPRPVPRQNAELFEPEFLELETNVIAIPKSTSGLSTGGYCAKCRSPRGVRSAVPLEIDEIDPGSEIVCGPLRGKASFLLLSERFLGLLTSAERECLGLRKVDVSKANQRDFYEITSFPKIPLVALKDAPATVSRCAGCKRKWWFYGGDLPFNFVSLADLPSPLPQVFVAGGEFEKVLCVSAARWRQIRTSTRARGIVTSRIGVLPKERALREPNREKPPSKIIARLRAKGLI
jgi:hypothetical protein